MKIKLPSLRCLRCDHKWTPRNIDVRQCPSCKSAYWDKAKEQVNEVQIDEV